MHTNEQFIKALNRKKEEAFQMLFKDYYASLVMYAMHYVRQEVAEDIVQDLMTLLWEKDTYFDSISAFIHPESFDQPPKTPKSRIKLH